MKYLIILMVLFITGCAVRNSDIEVIPASRVSDGFKNKEEQGLYHNVKKGETLYKISRAYDIKIAKIIEANKIKNPSLIKEGQLIYIPKAGPKERESDYIWPVEGNVISSYGSSTSKGANRGIDIRVNAGLTVKAARSGVVCYAGEDVKGYGKIVIIDHGNDIYTLYAYNETLLAAKGDFIAQGDNIAVLPKGSPVLHFEIRQKHKTLNPSDFL